MCFATTLNFLRSAISSCRTTSQGNNSLIGNCVSLRAGAEPEKRPIRQTRMKIGFIWQNLSRASPAQARTCSWARSRGQDEGIST